MASKPTTAQRAREIAGRISPCSWADDPAPLCQCSGCSHARRATPIILDAITTDAATIARLEEEVATLRAALNVDRIRVTSFTPTPPAASEEPHD